MTAESFDAFISYSRSASRPLASDFQSAIERFAKPWNKLRAVRVFRDDSSMSANAGLWSTIENAMDESRWFILLATPEASQSEYVNDEVSWWISNKGVNGILLVQAGGHLEWDRVANSFTRRTDAIPPALRDSYQEEPRWVDMRWYGTEGSLGSSDPRFLEAVADIAAPLRQMERDALVGENVQQHRKAVRLARAGVSALAVLLVLSLGASAVAVTRSREAIAQRIVAEEQARVATARQFAATAKSIQTNDVGLARLLAVEGYAMHSEAQTRAALFSTVSFSPSLVGQIESPTTVTATAGSVDGAVVLFGTDAGEVYSWRLETGARTLVGTLGSAINKLSVSADGSVVAASTYSQTGGWWADSETGTLPAGFSGILAVSPSGNTIAFSIGPENEDPEDFYPNESIGYLKRLNVGLEYELVERVGTFSRRVVDVELPDDTSVVAMLDEEFGGVEWRKLASFELLACTSVDMIPRYLPGRLTPGGGNVVAAMPNGLGVKVAPTNAGNCSDGGYIDERKMPYGRYEGNAATAVAGASDGTRVAVANAGSIYISDPRTEGNGLPPLRVLEGSDDVTFGTLRFLGNDTLLSASDSTVKVWDASGGNLLTREFAVEEIKLGSAEGAPPLLISPGGAHAVVETGMSGTFWYHLAEESSEHSPYRFLAWRSGSVAYFAEDGYIVGYEGSRGREVSRCLAPELPWSEVEVGGTTLFVNSARYITQTDRLMVAARGTVYTFDMSSCVIVATRETSTETADFSPTGDYAVGLRHEGGTGGGSGTSYAVVQDLTTGVIHELEEPVLYYSAIRYVGDNILALSPGGTTYALWNESGTEKIGSFSVPAGANPAVSSSGVYARYREDGLLTVHDLSSGTPIGSLELTNRSDGKAPYAFSADGSQLVIITTDYSSNSNLHGTVTVVDMDPERWIEVACETAGRTLTPEEWFDYTDREPPEALRCSVA